MKVLRFITGIFKLLGSLSLSFPRLLIHRKKSVAAFSKQLSKLDLDAHVVSELTACYRELAKLNNWMPKTQKNEAGQA